MHTLELDIMRRPIAALMLTAGLAMATVTAPSQAQAQWRGWGWGLGGFAIGALAGAAIASSTWGYPGYYGYGYPAYGYGYGYPAYGYGYAPAYSSRLTTVVTTGRTTAPMRTRVPGLKSRHQLN